MNRKRSTFKWFEWTFIITKIELISILPLFPQSKIIGQIKYYFLGVCVCVMGGGKKGVTKLFDLYCQHSPLTNHWYVYAMQLDFVLLVLEMS